MTRLPFELFLGLRYLKPKRTFVSVITLISLFGVAIGVWVLIVVIAVMSGFDRELREKLMGMHAHVTVTGGLIRDSDEIIQTALATPGVKGATPFTMGLVLVEYDKRVATPYLKGIDSKREVEVSKLNDYVKAGKGKLDLDGEKVVVGQELASQYELFLGDKITVYSPRNIEKKGEEVYLPMELTVTGIFSSGMYEYDAGLIFTSLETAQELYDLGNAVHGVEIVTDDAITGAPSVALALNKKLPAPLRAQTWAELNQTILGAIQSEKRMMFTVVFIITVVAAFSIMNTLIVVTVMKTREIGVLKALGGTPGKLMRIFLLQGVTIGAIGTLAGIAAGLLTIRNINALADLLARAFGWEVFPKDVYKFSEIPAYLTSRDLLTIAISALVICTVAGLIPALRAARLEPVEALRNE